MSRVIRIEPEDLERMKREANESAQQRFAEIVKHSLEALKHIERDHLRIAEENSSRRTKHAKFRAIADRLAKIIGPQAICAKGCSHCCNIAVPISAVEADAIGAAIDRKPAEGVGSAEPGTDEAHVGRWHGVACTFLKGGECSIYEARPIACRLSFSLGNSPFFCDTAVPQELSYVPRLNLGNFWTIYSGVMLGAPFADLREYFPKIGEP